MELYYQHCLHGDVQMAYKTLKALISRTENEERLIEYYENFFFSENPSYPINSDDDWIRKIVTAYYDYFVDVLFKKISAEDAEIKLTIALSNILNINNNDIDQIETILEKEFSKRGYYFLGGITAPFRGPYIWRDMKKFEYDVELPFTTEKVVVYFMDDFLMLSWLHFATKGGKSTGGWAKAEGLYCVRNRYEIDSTSFHVSFLKHEAQHLNDYKLFPHLMSWELEYRAKLVEIIYGDSIHLLHKFISEAKNDESFPHLYAAYKIKEDFNGLDTNCNEEVPKHALKLFKDHTNLLQEQIQH